MENFFSHFSRSLPENDWQLLKIGLAVEVQRKEEQNVKQEVEKVERKEEEEKEEEEKEEEENTEI